MTAPDSMLRLQLGAPPTICCAEAGAHVLRLALTLLTLALMVLRLAR